MNSWNNLAIFIYGNTSSFYSVSASSIQFQPSESQQYTTRFQYFHWIKQTGLIQRKSDLERILKKVDIEFGFSQKEVTILSLNRVKTPLLKNNRRIKFIGA